MSARIEPSGKFVIVTAKLSCAMVSVNYLCIGCYMLGAHLPTNADEMV